MHLGRLPRLTLRLLLRTAPSPDALFSTLFGTVRTTYRSALSKFAQIAHIASPVVVQPLAMCLSMHLIQFFFSLGTQISSLCGPNLHLEPLPRLTLHLLSPAANLRLQTMTVMESVTHPSIHPCIHAYSRPCIAMCIQRPISQYVMGGGWELSTQSSL